MQYHDMVYKPNDHKHKRGNIMCENDAKIRAAKDEVLNAFEEAAIMSDYKRLHERGLIKPVASRADNYRDLAPIIANAVERALKKALG